jgi:hypothetical protein
MREAYETIEKEGFVASIFSDEWAEYPFDNMDGMGDFSCWNNRREEESRYCELLGFDIDTHERIGKPHNLAVEIDKYEHSGISYSVRGEGMNCRWDTSKGWAVWFPDKCALDDIMTRKTKKAQRNRAVVMARQACELFNQWTNGDVWFYNIEDEQGNDVDSCGGFYGIESVREEVNSQLDYAIKEKAENLKETRQLVFG